MAIVRQLTLRRAAVHAACTERMNDVELPVLFFSYFCGGSPQAAKYVGLALYREFPLRAI